MEPTRVVESGLCAGYPGGGSTVSSAECPRSVESPESVTEGEDPNVGVTGARPSVVLPRNQATWSVSHDSSCSLWDGLRHDQIKGYRITTSQIPTTTQAIALRPRRRI